MVSWKADVTALIPSLARRERSNSRRLARPLSTSDMYHPVDHTIAPPDEYVIVTRDTDPFVVCKNAKPGMA